MDTDQTASQGPHCLLVCKIGLKSLQEYSPNDINVGFLGILRVKAKHFCAEISAGNILKYLTFPENRL